MHYIGQLLNDIIIDQSQWRYWSILVNPTVNNAIHFDKAEEQWATNDVRHLLKR